MRLESFQIRNYRSCLFTTLVPTPNLTALIGVNGSGKSNLLSAVLLLRKATGEISPYRTNDALDPNRSSLSTTIDVDGRRVRLRGEIHYYTSNRNIDEVAGTKMKWDLKEITGEQKWIDLPMEVLTHGGSYRVVVSTTGKRISYMDMTRRGWYDSRRMKNLLPENVFPVVAKVFDYLSRINYYSASQFSDPSRCPVSFELEDDKRRARPRRDGADHERFIYDLYRAFKHEQGTYKRFTEIIGTTGVGLVDAVRFDEIPLPSNIVEVRAGGNTVRRERTQLIVVPIFTVAGVDLSPNQLSEGTFKTLALLFYVLTDQSSLLLLEEPEVSIHHGLLSSIITLIKEESKKKQIIVTTHSDFVLDQLDPENVLLVELKDRKGTKARQISQVMSKADFKALKVYLEEAGNLGEYWREGGLEDA